MPQSPSPTSLKQDFFKAISGSDTAAAKAILARHPEAVTWRYADNGLNDPVTICAHDLGMLKLLLDHKADPDAANRIGDTRLIQLGDSAECAALLLDYGADINKPNENGLTPLMRAAFNHSTAVAKLLLERGADPDLRHNDGRTAAEIARGRSFNALADVIDIYSAKKLRKTQQAEIGHFNSGLDHDISTLRPFVLKRKNQFMPL